MIGTYDPAHPLIQRPGAVLAWVTPVDDRPLTDALAEYLEEVSTMNRITGEHVRSGLDVST